MFSSVAFVEVPSSDSDDEINDMGACRRILRDNSNVLELPSAEFFRNFRMNKEVFNYILDEIAPKLQQTYRSTSIPPIVKLSAFLRFLAAASYQKAVGNEAMTCMSQSKISIVIAECLEVFETHFCSKWIKMDLSEQEETAMKSSFYAKFGIPGVVGCVDGTHIRIKCPGEHLKHLYYNRKGYYSINAMAICDDNLIIRFIDARHPGANHDSFVWQSSLADNYFRSKFSEGKRNTWLLGDSGYQLLPYLLTPFRNPTSPNQKTFNERQIKARNCVERCFGVLKNRFRCIIGERGLHYSPAKATQIINVCCALHNCCIFYKSECDSATSQQPTTAVDSEIDDSTAEESSVAVNIRQRVADTLR